jgi:hypothetical protein
MYDMKPLGFPRRLAGATLTVTCLPNLCRRDLSIRVYVVFTARIA